MTNSNKILRQYLREQHRKANKAEVRQTNQQMNSYQDCNVVSHIRHCDDNHGVHREESHPLSPTMDSGTCTTVLFIVLILQQDHQAVRTSHISGRGIQDWESPPHNSSQGLHRSLCKRDGSLLKSDRGSVGGRIKTSLQIQHGSCLKKKKRQGLGTEAAG